ncbi:MAG: SIS domain-containing protein [Lachnospiraceae bacterium]|nr:SIS domain-containing protein [Lachnospiraceae bacterium]
MINYFEKQLQTIRDSLYSMEDEAFRKLVGQSVETIDKGGKIVVSGLGKNVPICEKFVGSMVSLGMEAYFLHTNSAVHGDLGIVKEGDLVILLTKSGETAESIYLAGLLEQRNVNLWLLTFERESTLTKQVQNCLVLDLEHEGDLWNIMPNNSTTINLMVLQGLVMQIAKEKKLVIDDFKRNHPGGHIGEVLKKAEV